MVADQGAASGAEAKGPLGSDDRALSPEAIRAAVSRIVASPDFNAPERARKFLRYVVEETLAGRADRIKAFSVAVEVFDRDSSFDAQNDPLVRIEAGRLRRALEHYYLLGGQKDPVVIEIPKGGYVPAFRSRPVEVEPPAAPPAAEAAAPPPAVIAAATPPAARRRGPFVLGALTAIVLAAIVAGIAWYTDTLPFRRYEAAAAGPTGPSVLVLPFSDLGDGATSSLYTSALTDELVSALGRFKELTVFGVQTSRSVGTDADLADLHRKLSVSYVVEGAVRVSPTQVWVTARLLQASNGAVLWSRRYEQLLSAGDLYQIQAKTAEEVATAVGQPYGIVFQTETALGSAQPPDNLDAYLCTLRYYVYRADLKPDAHKQVRECLEKAVAAYPVYATAWAMLSQVYLDEANYGFNVEPGPPTPEERALAAAREAVRLDPENARAQQALMAALFYSRKPEEAFQVLETARALNPADTELLGQGGHILGLAGRLDEGIPMMEQALARNPGASGFYHGALAQLYYMRRDYGRALQEIEAAGQPRLPIAYGVSAIIYAENGLLDRARTALETFQRLSPNFIPNLWAELDHRNIPVESQIQIAESLKKVGATIPERAVASTGAPEGAGHTPISR